MVFAVLPVSLEKGVSEGIMMRARRAFIVQQRVGVVWLCSEEEFKQAYVKEFGDSARNDD